MHCFWYQKRTKNRYTVVFSDTMSMGNHKTSCKQCVFTKYDGLFTNLSHAPIYRIQNTVFGTKIFPICCKCNELCLFEHKNHNTSCKQCILLHVMYFSPISPTQQPVRLQKILQDCFWYQKGPKLLRSCFSLPL
jgi:hypothetical protein